MAVAWVTVSSGVTWQKYFSEYFWQYLPVQWDLIVVEHTEAESWHGHFNELEANVFRWKFPCSEQIRTWIFVYCDWSIIIQVRNLWNSMFQNEASDVILGNPMVVHLNLTAGPVVASPRSSRWTVQSPWSPPEQFARSPVGNNAQVCVAVFPWKLAVQTGDQAMSIHFQSHSQ